MAETSCCSFCEQLPIITRPGRGTPSKCPLCKQELWISPDGVTQRLAAKDERVPRSTPRFLLAGLGVGLLALLCAGAALTHWTWKPKPIASASVAAPVVAPPLPVASARVAVIAPESPPVQVKRAIPDTAARVKPAKSMEHLAKSAVKPVPFTLADEGPRAKGVYAPIPPSWQWTSAHVSEKTLQDQMRGIPQLDLDPEYAAKSAKDLAAMAKDIAKQNASAKDGFIVQLRKDRPDLAGLPFLLGKDCALPESQALDLADASLATRSKLARALELTSLVRAKSSPSSPYSDAGAAFWLNYSLTPRSVPAVHQILSAQEMGFRKILASRLKDVEGRKATESLAKLALYDLDLDVRREAIKSLASRPKEEYLDEILRAFRYPWPPVARNATEVTVVLRLKELIPDLAASFNEPVPTAPFTVKTDDGKQKKMVRELVRVNHHRNCMLCHAPLGNAKAGRDIPLGPVTSMGTELPPMSSAVYYSERRGGILVRADVTYLRQDFSVVQEVKDPGKWPALQRFDFFVRTREFGEDEHAARPEVSPHRQAVLDALEGLTGKVGPPDAGAWQREVLAAPTRKSAFKSK